MWNENRQMKEAAFVFDTSGDVILWHLPRGRTSGMIPDSHHLWEFMWKNREWLGGVAHTHPHLGLPWPSGVDVTTWSACERGLGARLEWPIISMDEVQFFRWCGPGSYDYSPVPPSVILNHTDVERLRDLSKGE